jgi:Ca2+-binding RTX toxin-like protein
MTLATSAVDTIINKHHTADFEYLGGTPVTFGDNVIRNAAGGTADSREPYNGFIEAAVTESQSVINQMTAIITANGQPPHIGFFTLIEYMFEVFDDTSADYSLSTAAVNIDLRQATQHGGFAEGDHLVNVSVVTGSSFNDVIRGSNPSDFPADFSGQIVDGRNTQTFVHFTINNPGFNLLSGGNGNDILEGRGGDDILDGGVGFDFASYESSPEGVFVRLAGVGADTTTGAASRGDAAGDTLVSIEGLVGSRFDDTLTGNSLDNVLVPLLGNDTVDGRGGNDTVDYSRDHILDRTTNSPGLLFVHLSTGHAVESVFNPSTGTFVTVSEDTLISIENVIGTQGNDSILGNDQANTLDGRGGDDFLDGELGNDTIIGGGGFDTVGYASHDGLSNLIGEVDTISLGLNGADGSYKRTGIVGISFGSINSQTFESDVLRGIEAVTGSNHSETINGNEQRNVFEGRGGNDHINGGAGDDSYVFLTFTTAPSPVGNDVLFDESGIDDVQVSRFSDVTSAVRDGNDLVVTLTNGSFRVVDHFNGHQIENLTDSSGHQMVLAVSNTGGNAPGIIAGGNGGETLDGKGGDDFLFGGNGSDRLIGGDGNDRLTGGNGRDTFVFAPGFGNDVVTDFSHTDQIEFDGGIFQNFRAVQAATTQVGDDTVITLDANNSVTLQGVAADSLHASNFILT